MSLYEQIVDVGRDQTNTEQALTALQDVVQRFPNTEYARDAMLKIDLTQDHLAGKEMAVGRYYLHKGDYIGAINRFRVVVERYQRTPQIAEALERLTEAYYALGVYDEAKTAAAVLGANYPGSLWYQDSYDLLIAHHLRPEANPASWMARIFQPPT
jgi:outer membrane protein assembly factor BamD